MPRLRKFNKDLNVLNTVLTDLIARAKSSQNEADLEELQSRNYDKASGVHDIYFCCSNVGVVVSWVAHGVCC